MSKDALNPEATFVGIEQVGRTFEVHEAKVKPKKDLLAPVFSDQVLPVEELRARRLHPEPRGPSDDERRRHEATHILYASWCPMCVESRGVDDRHSSMVQLSSENTELQVQVDYMFFTGDMDLAKLKCSQQVAVPVLVATCNKQPAEIFAIACPRKGEHAFVQKTFGNYLRCLQRTKITLQTDQEEAIVSLMSKMPNELKGEIQLTLQKSPVGRSQSNGRAERAVRTIGGLTLAVLFEIQKTTGHRGTVDDPLLLWRVRHAGRFNDRYHVRQDSHLTAYHARCGKPYDGQITKFGASVLYMMPVKKSDKPKRLEHHWSYGVWVGRTEDSEEHIVLTSDGARIARTVHVLDEAVAKEKALWLHVCGVPWDPRKASHPDGKKLQKVQPVPILLPQAAQPDSEN